MSDFLTNLVIRSFSRTPSFQPLAATAEPAYGEPENMEQPAVAHQPAIRNTDHRDKEETIAAPQLVRPGLDEAPLIEAPVVVPPPPEKPIRRELEPQALDKLASPKPALTEGSAAPPPLETPKPRVELTTPEITSADTPPVQVKPSMNQTAQPVLQKSISSPPTQALPSRAAPRRPIAKTRKSEPPIVEQVIEHVTEQVTEQVIERPALTRSVTIENKQEITNSFTTLVPKPTAQPLPSVNVKNRPHLPPVEPPQETEPTALPPETVINVAIGRIEVRATPAAGPRRERQPAGPKVMTLDDYVQQRSRGAK